MGKELEVQLVAGLQGWGRECKKAKKVKPALNTELNYEFKKKKEEKKRGILTRVGSGWPLWQLSDKKAACLQPSA